VVELEAWAPATWMLAAWATWTLTAWAPAVWLPTSEGCPSDGCRVVEVGSVAGGCIGANGGKVEGKGGKKQPSTCGICPFLGNTAAGLLERVASLTVLQGGVAGV
jgi:hypothetical protein